MPTNIIAAALVLAPVTALAAVQVVGPDPPYARPVDRVSDAAVEPRIHHTSGAPPAERHHNQQPAAPQVVARAAPTARSTGWIWPLSPRPPVVRGFSVGPYRWSPGHRGVDLATRPSATVIAPAAGVVTLTRTIVGRPVIVITHAGGIRTAYEPALAGVAPGTAVPRGAAVGTVTAAPGHCGSRTCIHWSARRGDRYIDPLSLVSPPRVVLLPMSRVPPIDDG